MRPPPRGVQGPSGLQGQEDTRGKWQKGAMCSTSEWLPHVRVRCIACSTVVPHADMTTTSQPHLLVVMHAAHGQCWLPQYL